ncbi:AAA family ATPase [Variovorax sp. RTB1]|uniref:AAA family ATPase n=1 Tax=Variovorax sp. RTB1 TaxID=3048631 RepID=UPI002B23060E|nr:AAA family ATPase [Variovorax sp. RTB1]MEB0114356.1 AAA family ATPase [Variovorax sp. RTB1]
MEIRPQITLAGVHQQAEEAADMLASIRSAMLAPMVRKLAPSFSADQVATLCEASSRGSFAHRIASRKDMPSGTLVSNGRKRVFDLAETRQWVRDYRKDILRPEGAEAITISIANFKGGTTKTTTAMTLAQGLSLMGHKVLVIDTDPQASLTTLFGILPDVEIKQSDTLMALADGSLTSVRSLIRNTYWDGLDLVPSASSLFDAEFMLPNRQSREGTKGFEFYRVLDLGIDDVRADYDVIIIDSPPALSYLTLNALMAANGIIMPLPPETLDFASSTQFWSLFSDVTESMLEARGRTKSYDFINILLSRVPPKAGRGASTTADAVREWITATYKEKVLPLEIPRTSVASQKSSGFGTVYDSEPGDAKDKTYKRARDAYDLFVQHIEVSIRNAWSRQLQTSGEGGLYGTTPAPQEI